MLGSSKLMAFVGTSNAESARHFYETVLGLSFVADEPFALTFKSNGVMVRISKVDDVSHHPYTVLGWSVDDIRATVQALRRNGIEFQRFPYLEQDESGVWVSPAGAKV